MPRDAPVPFISVGAAGLVIVAAAVVECHWDRHAQADALLERCLDGENVRNIETVRQAKEGRRIPVLLTLSLLKDIEGTPRAVATFAKDISVLREVQKRLEEERGKQVAKANSVVFLVESIAARSLRDRVEVHGSHDDTLLLMGPPGAGEEAVAQAIHAASRRRGRRTKRVWRVARSASP